MIQIKTFKCSISALFFAYNSAISASASIVKAWTYNSAYSISAYPEISAPSAWAYAIATASPYNFIKKCYVFNLFFNAFTLCLKF